MYAVIKTGGKQYRVSPGDVLVVEKLDGEPGAAVAFGHVLMLGDGEAVTIGAPVVEGASVSATLVETRKGEKVKIFKKIRRQGYRRTRGHRQEETVLRVTGISADGKETKWDGEVSMVTKAELDARARGLDFATLNVSKKALKAAATTLAAMMPTQLASACSRICLCIFDNNLAGCALRFHTASIARAGALVPSFHCLSSSPAASRRRF